MSKAPTATPERRVALVVGNAGYTHLRKLQGPRADVAAMERVLRDHLQFEVIRVEDCDFPAFRDVRKDFLDRLNGAAVGLLYFSGHGISDAEGASFLLPTDARIEHPEDRSRTGVSVRELITDMQSRTGISLLFLDACRDDPFAARAGQRTKSAAAISPGFATVDQSRLNQVLVAYATSEGKTVPDAERGELSAFTKALVQHLPTEDQSLLDILVQVQDQVRSQTKGAQQPWTKQALGSKVFLGRPSAQVPIKEVPPIKEVEPLAPPIGRTYKLLAATGLALMLAWLLWWAMKGPELHKIAISMEPRGPKFVRSLLGQTYGCKKVDTTHHYPGNAPRFRFSEFDEAIWAGSRTDRQVDLPLFVFLRVDNTSAFPLINFKLKQGNLQYTLHQIPGNGQFASILLAGLALREPSGPQLIEGRLDGQVSGTINGQAWKKTFTFDPSQLHDGVSISCDSSTTFFFPPAE